MKLVITDRKQFAILVNAAASVIPVDGTLLLSASLTKGVTVTGRDNITLIRAIMPDVFVEQEGIIQVRAHLFREIVSHLAHDDVVLSFSGSELYIGSGETRYSLPVKPDNQIGGDLPVPESTICVRGLPSLINRSAFAAHKNEEGKKCLTFTFDEKISTVSATDGARGMIIRSECADGSMQLQIDRERSKLIASLFSDDDEVFVGLKGNQVVFFKENLYAATLVPAAKNAILEQMLDKAVGEIVYTGTVDAEAMYGCLDGLTAIFTKGAPIVQMCAGQSELCFEAESSAGTSRQRLPVHSVNPGAAESISCFNASYALEFLKKTTGPLELRLNKIGILLMLANQSMYLVMPTRYKPKTNTEEQPEKPEKKKRTRKTAAAA